MGTQPSGAITHAKDTNTDRGISIVQLQYKFWNSNNKLVFSECNSQVEYQNGSRNMVFIYQKQRKYC